MTSPIEWRWPAILGRASCASASEARQPQPRRSWRMPSWLKLWRSDQAERSCSVPRWAPGSTLRLGQKDSRPGAGFPSRREMSPPPRVARRETIERCHSAAPRPARAAVPAPRSSSASWVARATSPGCSYAPWVRLQRCGSSLDRATSRSHREPPGWSPTGDTSRSRSAGRRDALKRVSLSPSRPPPRGAHGCASTTCWSSPRPALQPTVLP